ncbi:MAG: DUF1292 domain-containing protein [Oscillospiraceae bacterium]
MSEMDDYTPELLSLLDEEGNEHEFEVLDTLELNDNRYLALLPMAEDPDDVLEDDGQLVIFKVMIDEETKEEYLEAIEDEDEFTTVSSTFMERLEEDFDFID